MRMNSIRRIITSVAALGVATAVLANCLAAAGRCSDTASAPRPAAPGKSRLLATEAATRARTLIGNVPLCFVENSGQTDSRVGYHVQGLESTIYFTSNGLTFALMGQDRIHATSDGQGQGDAAADPVRLAARAERISLGRRWTVKLDFVAANSGVEPAGLDLASTVVSYFTWPKDQWKTGLSTYSSVIYRNLWPGIDLTYSGTTNRLNYEFIVKPGADPRRIKLAYRGAHVGLTDDGRLDVKTSVASFQDDKPYSYQQVEGRRVEVETAYELGPMGRTDERAFGFRIGRYDRSKPLVLDPAVVMYSGFIGGSKNDAAFHIAVDAAGNAYVAGMAASNPAEGFPVTVGPNTAFTPDRQ